MQYGSTYWGDSNIRCWLNSRAPAGEVIWQCGNPPTAAVLECNAYDKEAGFLSNFTDNKLKAVKTVTHKSLLDEADIILANSGIKLFRRINSYRYNADGNYDVAYSENITDTMFLLDTKQLKTLCQYNSKTENKYRKTGITLTDEYIANSNASSTPIYIGANGVRLWHIYSRTPFNNGTGYGASLAYYNLVKNGGILSTQTYNSVFGITPAFYFNTDIDLKSGNGTEGNPYIVGEGLPEMNSKVISATKIDNTLNVNITVTNNRNTNKNVQIFATFFDADNKLKSVAEEKTIIQANTNKERDVQLEKYIQQQGDILKLFVWNDNMQPLSKVDEIPLS